MIDFVYVVSHGFAARMVTQTNLLGKLKETGKNVGLIAPDAQDANLKDYCKEHGIVLFEFQVPENNWPQGYLLTRNYFLEDLRNNVALMEKHIHAIRYHKSKNPIKRLKPIYYMAVHYLIKIFPGIKKKFIKKESELLNSPSVLGFLKEINPKVLISTYPVNMLESLFLKNAQALDNITTVIHLLSWDNISCKGYFPALADQYIAWGKVMADELKEYYNVPINKIHACGVPHFDLHAQFRKSVEFDSYLVKLGLNPGDPYLFFAMSSPRFAPYEIDIVEKLAFDVSKGFFGKTQLVIRPHPQNVTGSMSDQSWLPRIEDLSSLDNVAVDFPDLVNSNLNWSMHKEDMIKMTNLIGGADIIINSGSTVSIEALLHQKPVIISSFDGNRKLNYWKSARRLIDFPHLKKLYNLGGIDPAFSYNELYLKIEKYLHNPRHQDEKRLYALTQQCEFIDGSATEHVVSRLLSL